MVVDYQCHWYPPGFLEAIEHRAGVPRTRRDADGVWYLEVVDGEAGGPAPAVFTDLDLHIAMADAEGIDVLVIGPTVLGEVLHLPGDEAADILDVLHREYAEAQRRYPGRIVCLATLPLQDPQASLRVLDRAIVELGLGGVSVLATVEGRAPATDETLPVFRRIGELGVPVLLHPGIRSNTYTGGGLSRAEAGLGWMYHTARAALSFVDSGALDESPNLTVLHPHLGGVLPYVVERIDRQPGSKAKLPLRDYLRNRFYTDCVAPTPGALQFAINAYGLDRVLFATDHPFVKAADVKRSIAENATAEQVEAIYANRLAGLKLPA